MHDLWKLTSSPRHLMVFEAAARHGSFTKAAGELNVQQPAVSAAIQQLESSLGFKLFDREHRKVKLTTAGARLYSDTARGLDIIRASAQSLQISNRQNYVTLSASSAFTYYWMMPKLKGLHDLHPQIDLRLQSSDREPEITSDGIDLAIRRGTGDWPGCHSEKLATEIIYPVASPLVMASAKNLRTFANLLHERLIHLEEPIRDRPGWTDLFAYHGIKDREPAAGLRLNDYALVLQAAIAGEGFAFGWHHITDPLIEQGLLAGRKEWAWKTGQGFYLVWAKGRDMRTPVVQVRDWLLSRHQDITF